MPVTTTSATNTRRNTQWVIALGVAAVVVLLAVTGVWLLWTLPDANAFDARVERIFIENDTLTSNAEIQLLEILAQSGTAFSETLASYRMVIFVLLVAATALLIAALVFLLVLVLLNRRMAQIERVGIQINSLLISREEKLVILNDMEFRLTDAAIDTISLLAEARMDGDMLTGVELEAMISGKSASDCEEAAGATRIKRLRDALGNQMMAGLLIKTVARKGYVLSVDKDVIKMI